MRDITLPYASFISACISKALRVQYKQETLSDGTDIYHLFAMDGGVQFSCDINTIDDVSDVSDFESSHKDVSNTRIDPTVSEDGVTVVKQERIRTRYKIDTVDVEYQCDSDSWQLFHTVSLGTEKKLVDIEISLKSPHLLKLEIDDEDIITVDTGDMQNVAAWESFIRYSKDRGSNYHIGMNLLDMAGTEINIYQKRVSGSGKLGLYSSLLVYKENY